MDTHLYIKKMKIAVWQYHNFAITIQVKAQQSVGFFLGRRTHRDDMYDSMICYCFLLPSYWLSIYLYGIYRLLSV